MRAGPHRNASWTVVLTLLALVTVVSIAGFVHNDDGCAVERHCAACASALHQGIRTPSVAVALPISRRPLELPIPRVHGKISSGEVRLTASRAPPA